MKRFDRYINEIRDQKRAEIYGEWQSRYELIEKRRAIIEKIRAIR